MARSETTRSGAGPAGKDLDAEAIPARIPAPRTGPDAQATPAGPPKPTAYTAAGRYRQSGKCPGDAWLARRADTPAVMMPESGGEPGLHYLCPSYKAFFTHIRPAMDAMCQLLRAGRAPSDLVRRHAAADSRRGRNDPCPCGSGRKWKRCHQLPPGTTPRQ